MRRALDIAKYSSRGDDVGERNTRCGVIANLDVGATSNNCVTEGQPEPIVACRNVDAKHRRFSITVDHLMTTSQPGVNSIVGINKRQQANRPALIAKSQTVPRSWIFITEDVSLIRPVGDELSGSTEVQATHGDRFR